MIASPRRQCVAGIFLISSLTLVASGCGGGTAPTLAPAAEALQDAMIGATRSLDEATRSRASLARTALKLRSASTQTGDAIALLSAPSATDPNAPGLLAAARHQRDYLEAMQSAAGTRSRTDRRQALRSAQSAGRAASSAYVELVRSAPALVGKLPEASGFGIAQLRAATSAVRPLPARKPSVPPAPAPPTTTGTRTFHAPTGNVACRIDGESAACSVSRIGKTFVLPVSGEGYLEPGTRFARGEGEPFGWGSEVRLGDIACTIPPETAPRGISCVNAATGHGFEASSASERQKFF